MAGRDFHWLPAFKLNLCYGEVPTASCPVPAAVEEGVRAGKERKPRGLETRVPGLHREPQPGGFEKPNRAGLGKPTSN